MDKLVRKNEKNKVKYLNILVVISVLATIFHIMILVRVIPYEITWGGRLKTVEEMFVFETISILINSFFLFVLLQKGGYVSFFLGKKTVTIILWIYFVVFVLNTMANVFAKTNFEKYFAILTLINSILILAINKTTTKPSSH
ncbi:MAG: hypothetical protein O9282_08105 [Flavobacterium sp.]|uniref:hypothetical protein n=1 Tax=Flavobacterium sp. TaxID=239 RepID=UPI0022BFEC90|nr:hypothetical protein [Flavobacterium sp.]MCZ8331259.1 hypothetical protein [Flavobacterium sp.]